MQEEFLRKLSKSNYISNLVLKGGLFIYTLTNFESRATIDVDFLLRYQSNSIDEVKGMIEEIIAVSTGNDFIKMSTKGFEEISPQRKYKGVSTQIIGQIKNVRVPFNVDIGVGDIIIPNSSLRKISTQLSDFEVPEIHTYSLESTIAAKVFRSMNLRISSNAFLQLWKLPFRKCRFMLSNSFPQIPQKVKHGAVSILYIRIGRSLRIRLLFNFYYVT